MVDRDPQSGIQRRVAGYHDVRLDGLSDLLLRCRGWSILDLGCNRGMVGFEFACNGARLVHGCDTYDKGIETAREIFADIRAVSAQFEIIDLSEGPNALVNAFGDGHYDCVLLFAILHKLERVMTPGALETLLLWLGRHADKYVAGHIHEPQFPITHKCMHATGMRLIHRSYLADPFGYGPAFIWARDYSGTEPA